MATFKHISSKNADYGAAEQYLTFEHDEFTMKPTLDENGRLMLREDYRIATLNCGDEDFAVACMPATKEQLHEAMRNVGITADNPQDFSIRGYSDDPEKHIALPYEMVCAADVDELNFLAARLEQLDPAEVGKLNAALQQKNGLANIGQVIDFTYNVDFYVHIPEVHNYHDLGDYYLNQSGMVQMPEEWKGGIDLSTFGRKLPRRKKARLPSTAISWKAATSGNGSLRGAKCRKNTAL